MTDEKHSGAALTADERIQALTEELEQERGMHREELEQEREARWKAASASWNRNSVRAAAGDYLKLLGRIAQVEEAYPDRHLGPIREALETIKTVAFDGLREIGERCDW